MAKKSVIIISIFLFSLLWTGRIAASVELEEGKHRYEIPENMEVLEDEDGEWTVEDVTSPPVAKRFKNNSAAIPNYGYTDSNYWVRYEVYNTSTKTDWVLEIAYPPHDSISLYQSEGRDFKLIEKAGDLHPFHDRTRSHRNFAFDLSVPSGSSAVYYLKFDTQGAMQLPITLWEKDAFSEKSQMEYLILGLYYGLAFVMILYNLFLYFSLRFHSYLWYVLFILSLVFTHLTLNGTAYQFLWPESSWWNNRAIVFFMGASQAFALLFAKSFLHVKGSMPRLNTLLSVTAVSQFMILGLLMISYTAALNLVIFSAVLLVIIVLTTTGLRWKDGYRPARFFFIGWVIFLTGVLTSSLADAGLIPVTFYTKYASQIGAALEVVLFSLALADKFNTLRTEKEKAEREARESREQAVEQLKKANKLKDEFLANTSHELRTPLHGIIGIAESIYEGAADTSTTGLQQHVSMIIRSGRRLSSLVDDLLDMSRLRHKEMEIHRTPVSLYDTVQVVLSISEPLLQGKRVFVIHRIPERLPLVSADENRLQQILHNIIGNAVKFTEQGTITISAVRSGSEIKLTVQDTGIGMTKEETSNVFQEFEQGASTREQYPGGTGLGLSITKKLVELHDGSIHLDSEKNTGTTVTVFLPVSRESGSTCTVRKTPALLVGDTGAASFTMTHSVSLEKGRILIADDEPVNLQVLWNQLTSDGYQVTAVSNGREVMEIMEVDSRYDLLILDVMMPELSGLEVTRRLRERFTLTEMPILILTARNQMEHLVATFAAGANDYLAKPYNKEELAARAETLVVLSRVMKEVKEKQDSLKQVNEELAVLNLELEDRVKRRTVELEHKTDELLRMEQSRRHLLTNISHELGTPMTSLQGYVKAMMDGVIAAGDFHYLQLIYKKTLFLDRLIQDLYDLSKLEARQVRFHWEWISIPIFTSRFLSTFKEEVESRRLSFSLEDKTDIFNNKEYLFTDLDRLEQVMLNLIQNAGNYTNEGDSVHIEIMPSVCFISGSSDTKRSRTGVENRHIIIGIHDSGSGIAPESLPYIFERFFRGGSTGNKSSESSGTGLGLAISKEIIEYHNGMIWARSRGGEGSSFFFMLPLYPGPMTT
ncbi:ATP-binding protein [Salibacterium qingdaonense]|uniref:Circadian input-output histidine kinase CikA n=1 Tax=Salibacterium qingdaonense TaxID=266892 RepID=A0A1I4K318_9BACI|nr:ATP-binding protein [Salibacterium qingdaonense]SFL73154.1 Signal transduction histidine kinase [Salibacterium qingdaonense]